MPLDLVADIDEPVKSQASFTKDIGDGHRLCINFKKQAFWVYGGALTKRNFAWAGLGSPGSAFRSVCEEIARASSLAGA